MCCASWRTHRQGRERCWWRRCAPRRCPAWLPCWRPLLASELAAAAPALGAAVDAHAEAKCSPFLQGGRSSGGAIHARISFGGLAIGQADAVRNTKKKGAAIRHVSVE